eukprot:4637460-Amphidinium_carterae.1
MRAQVLERFQHSAVFRQKLSLCELVLHGIRKGEESVKIAHSTTNVCGHKFVAARKTIDGRFERLTADLQL